jgi:hypothetical protein
MLVGSDMAVNVCAERTRRLLHELNALHGEVCESEGMRMEGLHHLGTFMEKRYENLVYKYGHIKLKIHGQTLEIVDLMWPIGTTNGLEHALQYQKPRDAWRIVYDDSEKVYFKKTFESGDPTMENFMVLQAHMEKNPKDRELTLKLL